MPLQDYEFHRRAENKIKTKIALIVGAGDIVSYGNSEAHAGLNGGSGDMACR